VFVHLLVTNLMIPRPWRVGGTTLYPAGHLLASLDRHLASLDPPVPEVLVEDYRRDLRGSPWATIRVPALASGGRLDEEALDRARDAARDVVAVLRLFKRVSHRRISLERQTFGLAVDIGSVSEARWITDRAGRFTGVGWQRHGILGHWEFVPAALRAYRADPRFAYLDRALSKGDPDRDEWEGRLITAIRTMNVATVMQRPATRIMLLATALEALLGDKFQPGGSARGRGHQLARRSAYLWCGSDLTPPSLHRPGGRLACDLLTATGDPKKVRNLYEKAQRVWACSWYGNARELYDDRNEALHGAAAGFDGNTAAMHEFHLDGVVMAAVDWVIQRRPTSVADLDAEIGALPTA
jgi:hypothetical protein